MNVTIMQATVIVGALIFACSVLLHNHIGHTNVGSSLIGSAILAAPRGYATEMMPFPAATSPDPAPRSGRQQTSPTDWFAQDAKVRRVVSFTAPAGAAQKGQWDCACGGAWRYSLGGGPAELWRCLHCGGLHSGLDLVPEE
ncbi:MAG TPA: hypothetical protein VGP33_16205 [Chloroflexota bacterium]|jgi:hypothetical protein|nr:hypothetical protein [Chloroflexota bacterium]